LQAICLVLTTTHKNATMDKNTKKWLLVGGVGVAAGAFWYFFFGPGAAATTAAVPTSTSATTTAPVSAAPAGGYSAVDMENIAKIDAWIGGMASGSPEQEYWLGVMNANPSSATLAMWVACLNVFGTPGQSLTASQQAFWNNLSQGH
jgi:hypothetical protein